MDTQIDGIIDGDEEKSAKSVQDFIDKAAQTFNFPELSKIDKRKKLWNALFTLANSTKDKKILTNCFAAIRILSREKSGLNELVSNDWFNLIKIHSGLNEPTTYDFNDENLPLAAESLKSLCNLIFNSSVAAGMCCTNGILEKLAERVKTCTEHKTPIEVTHLDVKLIFLLTGLCSEARPKVKDDMDGVTSLIKLLDTVLKDAAEECLPNKIILNDQRVDLVCEILKSLFNLTINSYGLNDEEEEKQCEHLVSVLRMFILMPTTDKEKSLLLHNNIINLLTNIPGHLYNSLITPIQPGQNVLKKCQFDGQNMTTFYEMLQFLQTKVVTGEGQPKLNEGLIPVVTVLVKSANSGRVMRKYLRSQILPPLRDVHNRPEQGSTLRNHLCRLLTSPLTQLRDVVAELLFILCKKSVKRMIKYTGYGNAAGLFAKRGLLGGRSDEGEAEFSSPSEDSETEEYAEWKHGINPVIGCYEPPHPDPMGDMTEEQKEYEAMKLVELMDNMTRCGAIKPCRVGADGRPHPIEHVLQLQEGLKSQIHKEDSDSD